MVDATLECRSDVLWSGIVLWHCGLFRPSTFVWNFHLIWSKNEKKHFFVRSCQSNIELTSSYVWNVVGPIFLNIVHLYHHFFQWTRICYNKRFIFVSNFNRCDLFSCTAQSLHLKCWSFTLANMTMICMCPCSVWMLSFIQFYVWNDNSSWDRVDS